MSSPALATPDVETVLVATPLDSAQATLLPGEQRAWSESCSAA